MQRLTGSCWPRCNDKNEPNNSAANATMLAFGESAEGDICPVVDEDYYKFNGKEGQVVIADIDAEVNGSLLASELTLLAPDGTTVLAGGWDVCGGSADKSIEHILPADGTYYIKVDECSDYSDERYFYTLKLSAATNTPTQDMTLHPSADASVFTRYPTKNYGSFTTLSVKEASNDYHSFLKFDVSGLNCSVIKSATLRLYVKDGGPDGGSVYAVSNDWTESSINWRNAPSISGIALDGAGSVSAGQWVELDVTSAVSGNGPVSFALKGTKSDIVTYHSKEGNNKPELVIEDQTQSEGVPTAGFSTDQTTIQAGNSVQFTDESTGCPTNWTWSFGDGGTSGERNTSHIYSAPGRLPS